MGMCHLFREGIVSWKCPLSPETQGTCQKIIPENDLIEVVQFLKSNEKLKFRQLIDIAGVDYPEKEKRFKF